jgi:microcystin-dependent protein
MLSMSPQGETLNMSQPYVGQILMFAGNFPPSGWMTCSGQLLPISEYETLFNLIGTTYGGDGQSTFGLPDLQGRVAIHQGQGPGISQNYVVGAEAGTETVTLNSNQIPLHNHMLLANTATNGGTNQIPSSSTILANEGVSGGPTTPPKTYLPAGGTQVVMSNASIANAGGNQPHNNIQPVLAITYCISLFGIFPSPN